MLPQTPSFRLDGCRALVTGASRGIGLGAAAALAQAGAAVVLAARGMDALGEAVEAFKADGFSAEALPLDAGNPESAGRAIEAAGPFDVLVNNAGTSRHSAMIETTVEDFDAVASINFRGAYFVMQAVARGMIAAGRGGSIVNVSSQMGHVGGVDRAVYAATKHAVEGFTKAAAIELGRHNIRVNTVCPTFVRTPMTEKTFADPDRVAWIREKIKLPRVAEVEDVMGAVLFLASDASAMVTGTALLIDGGWTAG